MRSMHWQCAVVLVALLQTTQAKSLKELLEENPDLSEFWALLKNDTLTLNLMQSDEGTVFAPNNAAMRKYKGVRNYQMIKYHMADLALPTDVLVQRQTVLSQVTGSQPIYVTVQHSKSGKKQIFVNNAQIVSGDYKALSDRDSQDQILHIIDEVLEPTLPNVRPSSYRNPNALKLLANSPKYRLGGNFTIRKFYQRVQELDKLAVFDSRSYSTYFVPVDESFDAMRDGVDRKVLDAHVIPGKVLFTRTMGNNSYETLTFGDGLKVTVSLHQEPYPKKGSDSFSRARGPAPQQPRPDTLYEIQSNTIVGDMAHKTGTTLVKLVKPNIAVKNGVVHLIKKPLMLNNQSVFDFIQDGAEDRFYEFHRLIYDKKGDFVNTLMSAGYVTVFIPSNEAFYSVDQKRLAEVKTSPEKLKNLLSLHLVRQHVTTDIVRKSGTSELYNVQSDDPNRELYLSVSGVEGFNQTMTVEGGGTNATVTVADIFTTNGVIHIIDKLLGIPYRSVGEKLAVDAMMSATNTLARQHRFASEVSRMDQKYTMFVPSNAAWEKIRREMVTSHKLLFSGKNWYHANAILERHLIIGEAYSMEELANVSRHHGHVQTYKDRFQIEDIPGTTDYVLKWEGQQARVVRSNVECTNGYIHVIDTVMMRERDVTSGGGDVYVSSAIVLVAALVALRL